MWVLKETSEISWDDFFNKIMAFYPKRKQTEILLVAKDFFVQWTDGFDLKIPKAGVIEFRKSSDSSVRLWESGVRKILFREGNNFYQFNIYLKTSDLDYTIVINK